MDEPLEAGPEIVMHTTWVFKLNKRDSLLVLKALGGRLAEAERPEAEALDDRLTVLRAAQGAYYIGSLSKAAEAVARKQGA